MIWKTVQTFIFATVISGSLVECSQVLVESQPDVADAHALIQESVARNSDGRLKLISLANTGGRRMNVPGTDTYELWYNAVVELTRDAWWTPTAYRRFSTLPPTSTGGGAYSAGKKGEQVTIAGTLTFAKDKSGWTIQPDERYK
jgi:hypothetical protein